MSRVSIKICWLLFVISPVVVCASSTVDIELPEITLADEVQAGEYTVCHVGNVVNEHRPKAGEPASQAAHVAVGDKITVTKDGIFANLRIENSGGTNIKADVSMIGDTGKKAFVATKAFNHFTGGAVKEQNHLLIAIFIKTESIPVAFADNGGKRPDGCDGKPEPATGLLGLTFCWEGKVMGKSVWKCELLGPHLGHVHAQD